MVIFGVAPVIEGHAARVANLTPGVNSPSPAVAHTHRAPLFQGLAQVTRSATSAGPGLDSRPIGGCSKPSAAVTRWNLRAPPPPPSDMFVRPTPIPSDVSKRHTLENQSRDFSPPDVFVADLKSFSAVDADKLWCPVRALKWYVHRTKQVRAEHKQLFITSVPPFRPASRDTITRWLITAIRSALSEWPEADNTPFRAHDIRSASTSWAYFKGVPMADIVQAACWKSANTFSECYLKDVVQTEGRAGRTVLGAAAASSRRHKPPVWPSL